MDTETYKIRKEAAWVVLNAIVGGTNQQIMFLVSIGVIGPVCDLLLVKDTRVVVMVTLEGLECVMKAGIANKMEYRENRIASVTLIPPIPNNNSN